MDARARKTYERLALKLVDGLGIPRDSFERGDLGNFVAWSDENYVIFLTLQGVTLHRRGKRDVTLILSFQEFKTVVVKGKPTVEESIVMMNALSACMEGAA